MLLKNCCSKPTRAELSGLHANVEKWAILGYYFTAKVKGHMPLLK